MFLSNKIIWICYAILVGCGQDIDAQLISPCPQIFQYESVAEDQGHWTGKVTINTDTELAGVWLDILLDKPANTLVNWFGASTTRDNKLFVISDSNKVLPAAEAPFAIKFLVRFEPKKAPKVQSIRINGRSVCNVGSQESPITNEQSGQKPKLELDGKVECGKVPLKGTPFIRQGERAAIEDWPWHLAIYFSSGPDKYYGCGGTLVSKNYAVTAGHCLAEVGTEAPRNVSDLLVYLGTSDLRSFHSNVQVHSIAEIHIHPAYNRTTFYNDIGLLKLRTSATFNENVWPICLWEGDASFENHPDQTGLVVGWGKNEGNVLATNLMKLVMPVVNLSTCLSSDRLFFAKYLFENNYCAGYKNGSAVCNGDSGGGMVFERRNNPGTWQLRGIVSVGAIVPGTLNCHPSHYSIFTDVSKYLEWIQGIINIP